jgi:hypothetical protein
MMMTDDVTLLREYARSNSEEAFAARIGHMQFNLQCARKQIHCAG